MSTVEEIRADIEATRAELAETADALATKLDEKAQAAKRVTMIVAGAIVALVVTERIARKVRNRSPKPTSRTTSRSKGRRR
jgi:Protein of unknown function (DUF3618)